MALTDDEQVAVDALNTGDWVPQSRLHNLGITSMTLYQLAAVNVLECEECNEGVRWRKTPRSNATKEVKQ